MAMSHEKQLALAVSIRPCIWDKSDLCYSDKEQRLQAFQEVSKQIYGYSTHESHVRLDWERLRSRYVRWKHDSKTQKCYSVYKMLSFLDPHIVKKSRHAMDVRRLPTKTVSEKAVKSQPLDASVFGEENPPLYSSTPNSTHQPRAIILPPKIEPQLQCDVKTLFQVRQLTQQVLQTVTKMKTNEQKDTSDYFGMHVAQKLRLLNEDQRERAKVTIAKIMHEMQNPHCRQYSDDYVPQCYTYY